MSDSGNARRVFSIHTSPLSTGIQLQAQNETEFTEWTDALKQEINSNPFQNIIDADEPQQDPPTHGTHHCSTITHTFPLAKRFSSHHDSAQRDFGSAGKSSNESPKLIPGVNNELDGNLLNLNNGLDAKRNPPSALTVTPLSDDIFPPAAPTLNLLSSVFMEQEQDRGILTLNDPARCIDSEAVVEKVSSLASNLSSGNSASESSVSEPVATFISAPFKSTKPSGRNRKQEVPTEERKNMKSKLFGFFKSRPLGDLHKSNDALKEGNFGLIVTKIFA